MNQCGRRPSLSSSTTPKPKSWRPRYGSVFEDAGIFSNLGVRFYRRFNAQNLDVFASFLKVKDAKHECTLGTLTVPLSRLLEAEDMTLNQRFPLKNSGPSCTLKMKIALRVKLNDFHNVLGKYFSRSHIDLQNMRLKPWSGSV